MASQGKRSPSRKSRPINPAGTDRLSLVQSRLGAALAATSSLKTGLGLCLEAALEVSGVDCGGIYLMDTKAHSIALVVHNGLGTAFVRSQKRHAAGSSFFARVLAGAPIYSHAQVSFLKDHPLPASSPERKERLKATAAIPILARNRVVACLNVGSLSVDAIPAPSRRALEAVAGQIGLALMRLRAEQASRRSHAALRRLAAEQAETQENERRRIARELHDQVGQTIAGLALSLKQFLNILPRAPDDTLRGRLSAYVRLLEETTGHIRGIIADLRPPLLDEYGLSAALHQYGKDLSARTNVPVRVWIDDDLPRLKPNEENALFRIAQEALANACSHAGASEIVLSLEADARSVHLLVRDNGAGFDVARAEAPSRRPHWGLSIMKERALGVGGQCRVVSAPGGGTQVIAEVPR